MKGFLVAIGLVVVVVLTVVFFSDPAPQESPVRPSVAVPDDRPEQIPPPPLTDGSDSS